MLVEEFPCWRQTQACAMADKQRLTKFFLQGFHLETNGRLGQRQACGGPGKTPSRATHKSCAVGGIPYVRRFENLMFNIKTINSPYIA